MALVRGQPQFNIETNDKRSIGYEAGSRRVAIASVDTIGAIQADMNVAVTASRSVTIDDTGKVLICNSSTPIVITIDSDTAVGWAGSNSISICRLGVGSTTFAAGDGVTIHGDISTPAQYGTKRLTRVASNLWSVTHSYSDEFQYPAVLPSNRTCYFWAWPGTGNSRSGEHHLYVPVGTSRNYYGWIIGVRGKSAYSVPFEVVSGIFTPGLHTLASACTRVGTWGSSANASALHGLYYYSVAAGATISASVTGSVVAVQMFFSTNGGYGVVSIDGDYTSFSSKLPVFTEADFSTGLCRAGDVGKRYVCSYFSTTWSQSQALAEGLSSGTHSVTIEVTGTKPTASSDYRLYIESIIGCGTTNNIGTANVHMVPIRTACEVATSGGSAYYSVPSYAPDGSTDYQFITSVHADNSNCKETSVTGPTVFVDGVDRSSPTLGTYYSGDSILWSQESEASHKTALSTPVVNRKRTISAMANRRCPVMIDVTLKWLAAGKVKLSYPCMLPVNAYDFQSRSNSVERPVSLYLGGNEVNASVFSADNDATYNYWPDGLLQTTPVSLLARYSDFVVWATLFSEKSGSNEMLGNVRYLLQDRADKLDKLYVVDSYYGYAPVAVNDTQRYVIGYGALKVSDF